MIIRRARENDYAAIVNLINGVFGSNHDVKWFTHFHHNNPNGKSTMWLAQDDGGDVVSYRSIVRFNAHYLDELLKCGQLANACTRADYRGRGVYSKVHAKTMEDFFESGGDMIYAFPVTSNYRVLTSRFGFQHVANIRGGFCPLGAYRTSSVLGDMAKRAHELVFRGRTSLDTSIAVAPASEGLAIVAFSADNGEKVAVDRSHEFLKWRTSMPGRQYWIAVMDECNYAFLGEAFPRGLRTLTVLDMRYVNQYAASRLLSTIQNWADAKGYQGVFSWLGDDWFVYSRSGFVPVPKKTPLVVKFSEAFPYRHAMCRSRVWGLRMLDTDYN